LYVIVGLATLTSAAYGLISGLGGSRAVRLAHSLAVALLAVAWLAGHGAAVGWSALLLAGVIELIPRLSNRNRCDGTIAPRDIPRMQTSSAEDRRSAGVDDEVPAMPALEPARIDPPRELCVSCCALLGTAWSAGADVFLASLRRNGQHEAILETTRGAVEEPTIRIGSMKLELRGRTQTPDGPQIAQAAKRCLDWPEAGEAVRELAGVLELIIRSPADTPPAQIVRQHLASFLALREFIRIRALYWPAAQRITPLPVFRGVHALEFDPTRTCISFQELRHHEPKTGRPIYVSFTLGLHAFGLSDIEIWLPHPAEEAISALIYRLAGGMFAGGTLPAADDLPAYGASRGWRAEAADSIIGPNRAVIRLSPLPATGFDQPSERHP